MMKRKSIKQIIIISCICSFIAISCKNNSNINISNIHVEIKIKRLDQDLFELDLDNISNEVPKLSEKYGKFYELFNYKIIKIGGKDNPAYPDYLKGFLTDYTIHEIFIESNKIHSDIKPLNNKLSNAFKRYRYYFPDNEIPHIYTFIGGFNQSMVVGENTLGIGLDKYLGANCKFYNKLEIPKYIRYNMTSEKISSDCIKAWMLTEYTFNDSINNVLANMLYHGKIMHLVDIMLPEEDDTLKFGFTADQMEWCKKNEEQMWDYLIENKHLFETNYIIINKYFNESPYTKFFTMESPGKAAIWLGSKIIASYLKNNSNLSLNELMNENNYQKILNQSRYNP